MNCISNKTILIDVLCSRFYDIHIPYKWAQYIHQFITATVKPPITDPLSTADKCCVMNWNYYSTNTWITSISDSGQDSNSQRDFSQYKVASKQQTPTRFSVRTGNWRCHRVVCRAVVESSLALYPGWWVTLAGRDGLPLLGWHFLSTV